jgi:hypothetical protein
MTSTSVWAFPVRQRPCAHHGLLLFVVSCFLWSGCGGPEYDLAPVSGRVTMAGKPLADVKVSFQPTAKSPGQPNPGPGSYGTTDAEGRFTLRTIEPEADGAVVGTHRVHLRTKPPAQDPTDDRAPVFKEIVPPRWRDGSQTFEVPPEGTQQADFELTSR